MFMKPLEQVTFEDINYLISKLRYQESEKIEYKSTLPAKGNEVDPWILGKNTIGDRAIKKITAEVIAFANTHGGTIILGVEESEERPPRPNKIKPLPRCRELAHRLMESITDSIEPALTSIQNHVIDIDEDGGGIILFRVERSDNAPHRSTKDKSCYIRVQDRCVIMTMTEIQKLSVKRSRQMIEGLWTAKFGMTNQFINGGVVILDKGRLYGGDSNYMYTGMYENNDENLIASIYIEHYQGEVYTAFNTGEKQFSLNLFGKFQENTIRGILSRISPPQAQNLKEIEVILERKRELV